MRDEAPPRPDPLEPLIGALHEEGRPRVWSLIVTVFGDAAAPRGGRVATGALAALLGRVGVAEGALRTALSRLVADGTLRRDRRGRASFHRLSARAARETAEASRVIYAAPPGPEGWLLGAGPPPPRALVLPGGAWLSREAPPEGAVAVQGALLGGARVTPEPAHAEALARLGRDLGALEALLGIGPAGGGAPGGEAGATGATPQDRAAGEPASGDPSRNRREPRLGKPEEGDAWPPRAPKHGPKPGAPGDRGSRAGRAPPDPPARPGAPRGGRGAASLAPLDAMAARVLLVHRWRRLALRWPDLPEGAPGSDARARVAAAYGALRPASERWLDEALPGAEEAPGAARGPRAADRFG